ncbi:hypothetical protein [Streptomyces goshikiensis]|uniref:hypothetical protein n=1 Tax=Streptomyces goshikiensis TaxID=1942 RepID=UPI003667436A
MVRTLVAVALTVHLLALENGLTDRSYRGRSMTGRSQDPVPGTDGARRASSRYIGKIRPAVVRPRERGDDDRPGVSGKVGQE